MKNIDTLEEIIDRFVPCMCGFIKGFAYNKNTKCDCDNSEAMQALNLYIEERERLARKAFLNELVEEIDNLDVNDSVAMGAIRNVLSQFKELESK